MILQIPNSPNLHILTTILLAYIVNEEQVHILSNLDAVIDHLVQVSFVLANKNCCTFGFKQIFIMLVLAPFQVSNLVEPISPLAPKHTVDGCNGGKLLKTRANLANAEIKLCLSCQKARQERLPIDNLNNGLLVPFITLS